MRDDYGRFMRSVSGESMEWREEIAVDSFLRLEGGQRANAEKVLIRRLAAVDDWRIPPALAAGRVEQAVPVMQERLANAEGKFRLTLMNALTQMGLKVNRKRTLTSALKEEGEDGPIGALITLKSMDPAEVPEGILEEIEHAALTHPAGNVRCSAAAALLFLTRVSTDPHFEYRPLILSFHQALETRRQSLLEIKKMMAAAGK
ncbi:MAG: hypothetical protein JNN08_07645 [Bryobacterales bacterium]|nr:hypothetical protein [Bryobacterales bacterium]